MGIFITLIALALIAVILLKFITRDSESVKEQIDMYLFTPTTHSIDNERLEKPVGDYEWYSLIGMQFRGLNRRDYGIFEGKAIAEISNQYDKYAVGIHRADNGKLVGYIRKGENEELHNYIMEHGGSVHASFRVWERDGDIYACAFVHQKVER